MLLGPAQAIEPLVAIIIDDVGYRLHEGRRAAALPAPVTLSFLPHTPYAARLAREAHALGKEVMLHLPMAALQPRPLGPGGLTWDMDQEAFLATLRDDLAAVPHARGINNHMGSLMTTDPTAMKWLMGEIRLRGGLFFVDSRTTAESVARRVAVSFDIPSSRRDVFLDNEQRPEAIVRQLESLTALARRSGSAIAIGHAHPATLAMLEQHLPRLASEGIRLAPVSQVIAYQQAKRPQLWQASLSPSPTASKSSKP